MTNNTRTPSLFSRPSTLEIGQTYKTRDGTGVAKITKKHPSDVSAYDFLGTLEWEGNSIQFSWGRKGEFLPSSARKHEWDLMLDDQ